MYVMHTPGGMANGIHKTIVLEQKIRFPWKNTVNLEIFVNNVTRHVCDVTNLQLEHDLPTSVNGSDFGRVLNFLNL